MRLYTAAPTAASFTVLLEVLSHLRLIWAHEWTGLNQVLKASQAFLTSHGADWGSLQSQSLLNCADALAQQMERNANALDEPQYHNRLHTADAICGLTILLAVLKQQTADCDDEWMAGLLLAVTAHDFLHPGGANTLPHEIEAKTVKGLENFWRNHPISESWRESISRMIIQTDPALVQANHDRVEGRDFSCDPDWACVLLNEADILASATQDFGPQLGQQLAREWKLKNLPLSTVVGTLQGRLGFLKSLRFTSPASLHLQLPSHVAQQITILSAQASSSAPDSSARS